MSAEREAFRKAVGNVSAAIVSPAPSSAAPFSLMAHPSLYFLSRRVYIDLHVEAGSVHQFLKSESNELFR